MPPEKFARGPRAGDAGRAGIVKIPALPQKKRERKENVLLDDCYHNTSFPFRQSGWPTIHEKFTSGSKILQKPLLTVGKIERIVSTLNIKKEKE